MTRDRLRQLFRQKKWKAVTIIVVAYLIRDLILYVLLPLAIFFRVKN